MNDYISYIYHVFECESEGRDERVWGGGAARESGKDFNIICKQSNSLLYAQPTEGKVLGWKILTSLMFNGVCIIPIDNASCLCIIIDE